MPKMSTPSIFPSISSRSRPVACSRSDGTVPGAAPGPIRSDSVLTSAHHKLIFREGAGRGGGGVWTIVGFDLYRWPRRRRASTAEDRRNDKGALWGRRHRGCGNTAERKGQAAVRKHCVCGEWWG